MLAWIDVGSGPAAATAAAQGLHLYLRPVRQMFYTFSGLPPWPWLPKRITTSPWPGIDAVLVPLYIPFTLLALPTALLFHRDRRSVRWAIAGRCRRCGYNLAGLPPTTPCPECGRRAPA